MNGFAVSRNGRAADKDEERHYYVPCRKAKRRMLDLIEPPSRIVIITPCSMNRPHERADRRQQKDVKPPEEI